MDPSTPEPIEAAVAGGGLRAWRWTGKDGAPVAASPRRRWHHLQPPIVGPWSLQLPNQLSARGGDGVTADYKLAILRQAGACTRPGETKALLRRRGFG